MSQQKKFLIIKKGLSSIVCLVTVLSLVGIFNLLPVKQVKAASATVSFMGSGGEGSGQPFYQIPPMGDILPASSGYSGLFSFQIKKSSGSATTLSSVKVLLTNAGSGTLAADDILGLAVFKRISFDYSGGFYTFPDADKVGEKTTGFAVDGTTTNTITITTGAIPTDYWGENGAEYYVAVKTSANWSGTDQLSYKLPAAWITVSDGTLGSACPTSGATCQPLSDIYYATAPTGWVGEQFMVEEIDYMGTNSSGDHEVEVRFSNDVSDSGAGSALTTTKYTVFGTSTHPASATKITPDTVRLVFADADPDPVVPNQTQLTVANTIQNLMGNTFPLDVTMMIMGVGTGPGGGSPLLISEVVVGTAASPLEEFIELYNPSPSALNLGTMNIKVWAAFSSGGVVTHTKFASLTTGTIAAYGYYLIASSQYAGIDPAGESTVSKTYDATIDTCDDTEGCLRPNAGVYLSTSDSQNVAVFDRLGWGTASGELTYGPAKCSTVDPLSCSVANNGKSLERKANFSSTATSMASGGPDETNGNMYVSHDNQYDFIQRTTADPQGTGITETPGGAGFTTNNYPFINHMPLDKAIAGQDLIAIAEFNDDSGVISSVNTKLYYRYYDTNASLAGAQAGIVTGQACADPNASSCWNSTTGTAIATGSNSFRFTIPSANLNATQDLQYFLRVYDGTHYTCLPPGTSGAGASCGSGDIIPTTSSPWYVDVLAAGGTGVISGRVEDTSAPANGIPDVLVFTEGMPFTATTNASGYFTISGLPDGVYDLRAQGGSYTVNGTTVNYMEGWKTGIYLNSSVGQTSSGNTIVLQQGVIENRGGTSADTESPWVMWSAPNDMMQGFPKNEDLIVVFDKAMRSTLMSGGSATTDNIYLMDVSGQVVAGTVIYCDTSSGSDTCTSGTRSANWPQAQSNPNLLVYNPTSDLSSGASYTLVLTEKLFGQNGKQLMGNRPSGGHSIQFTVAMDFMGTGGAQGTDYQNYSFGSGASFPPYVTGTTPGGGAFNVALNTNIYITFNKPMAGNSINTTNIKLYSVVNPYMVNEAETAVSSYTVTQNTAGDMAIIDPSSNLTANTHYRVKVLSNCTSADGTPMSNADNAEQFRVDFETGSSTDSTPPTVTGTYPNNNAVDIPSNLPAVTIGFSEGMDPSTINTATVKLKRGTSVVASIVEYDVGAREARLIPTNALRPAVSYIIQIVSGSSGVKDIVGNALATDYEASFTTDSTVDITAPYLEYARCDDFSCSITFSEPMINVRADDTTNFDYSVLKPANYALVRTNDNQNISTANARMEYDQMNNTVQLQNISGFAVGDNFRVTVSSVKDKTGNVIGTPNTFSGAVENSMATGGMMGPGGNMMMGPVAMMDAGGNQYGSAGFTGPAQGGQGTEMTTSMGGSMGFDYGGMWMEPINAMPMNMMAGVTTQYMIEFKADAAIPSGGTIKITFPTGTDVTNAAAVSTTKSMANKDINGPMDSTTVTIALVTSNAVARTVTVTTSGVIAADDFIMFDIGSIQNPTVPKSFDTNGYTADIKTFNVLGALLQSETTMPYFINASGTHSITGTISTTGSSAVSNGQTLIVYLGSPMTGPMEATATFAGGNATYTFSNLPQGDYWLNTEPSISLTTNAGSKTYIGYTKPDPLYVDGAETKNFSITEESNANAYELTVRIFVNFSGSDFSESADRQIDIWAGGSSGQTMKTVTLNQSDYTTTPYSVNLYLPAAGEYWIGMGPAMPKGTMMMGPPPMPSWMPPQDIRVSVSGAQYNNPTWNEQSGTANDGTIDFTVGLAANQIIGYVVDGSGNAISNVDVDAHRTQGGFGMPSHAKTDTSGRFILKVTTGVYEINAWMPGMPWSPGRVVDVRDNTAASDGNATADVYKDNGTVLVVDLTSGYNSSSPEQELLIKLNKSSTTISGKLLDNNDNPVAYAPVWAYSPTTGENRPSGTDSSGSYTIYVPNGSWNVESHIPGLGDVSYANNPVTVSGSNRTDINVRPASNATFYTISGTVTIADSVVSNASVWVDRGTYHNQTNTNSSGVYRLTVPANSGYTLKCWTPDYGEMISVTVDASTDNVTQNFTVTASAMKTLTVNFTGSSNLKSGTEAFLDVFKPGSGGAGGRGNHKRIDDLSITTSTTLNIPADSGYEIHIFIPGIGGLSPTCQNDGTNATCSAGSNQMPDSWTINENASVTFDLIALGDLYTFQITLQDASLTALSDAFVWMDNTSSGFHAGSPTNSSGLATLKIPAGTYKLGGDKPGYTGPAPVTVIAGGASDNLATLCTSYNSGTKTCSKTLTLSSNPYTLSGTITNSGGSPISGAWVWADKVVSDTDFSFAGGWTGDETDPNGTYSLSISDGWWLVKAVADGYQETSYNVSGVRTAIQVNGDSVSGKTIVLNARANYTAVAPKSAPVTPVSGGTVDDSSGTGVKLIIPPSALGTDTSASTVNITDTYSVPSTGSITPLGGKGKEITATNSSGQAVTCLTGSATIEISYSESDIPSGVSESQLLLAYFDEASNQWVEVPATIDTTNNKITGSTTHFSQYIIGSSADTGGPSKPGTPTASSTSSSSISFSWTASTDNETSVDGYQILRSTDGTNWTTLNNTDPWATGSYNSSVLNATTSYTDSNLSANTTYYYHVVAFDTAGNHSEASNNLTATTQVSGGGGLPPSTSKPEPEPEPVSEPEAQVEPEPEPEPVAKPITEMSINELKAEITRIQGLIIELQTKLTAMLGAPVISGLPTDFSFKNNLEFGMVSQEVKYLQIVLNSDVQTKLAETGVGSSGQETNYFALLTKAAVVKFQEKYATEVLAPWQLAEGTGYVGGTTREKLNSLLGK